MVAHETAVRVLNAEELTLSIMEEAQKTASVLGAVGTGCVAGIPYGSVEPGLGNVGGSVVGASV